MTLIPESLQTTSNIEEDEGNNGTNATKVPLRRSAVGSQPRVTDDPVVEFFTPETLNWEMMQLDESIFFLSNGWFKNHQLEKKITGSTLLFFCWWICYGFDAMGFITIELTTIWFDDSGQICLPNFRPTLGES